jgi:hypothetical protein
MTDLFPIDALPSILQSLPGRQSLPAGSSPLIDAVLETWRVYPAELGTGQAAAVDVAGLRIDDRPPEEQDIPEARIAALWRQAHAAACSSRALTQEDLARLLELGAQPLWEPAQAWVFRLLAASGCRKEIASLLPASGPLSLPQAEALLEAQFPGDDPRSTLAGGPLQAFTIETQYPEALSERWRSLLRLEVNVFLQPQEPSLEGRLQSLADYAVPEGTPAWLAAEQQRISARAGAALIRHRLGRDLADGGWLASPLLQALPDWERLLLEGLVAWQQRDPQRAGSRLWSALEASPHQSAVLYAASIHVALTDPLQALVMLTEDLTSAETSPTCAGGLGDADKSYAITWQAAIAQAALMARLGEDQQPGFNSLVDSLGALPRECLRWSWKSADAHSLRQERLLGAACRVRQGDLPPAERLLQAAFSSPQDQNLNLALSTFAAWQILKARPGDQSWQAEMLHRKVSRGQGTLARTPPAGNPDLQFFQAALSAEKDRQRAIDHIQSLLRQRAWCQREISAGGSRLLYLADLSLRLGHPELALQVCDCLDTSMPGGAGRHAGLSLAGEARSRRWIARLAMAMQTGAGAEEVDPLVEQILLMEGNAARDEVQDGWTRDGRAPHLLLFAAAASLAAGGAHTGAALEKARQQSAPEATCRFLESLKERQPAALSLADIQELPGSLRAAASLLGGAIPLETRLRDYITALGLDWELDAPLEPLELARHVLRQALQEDRSAEVLQWLTLFEGTDREMFKDLAARTRLLLAVRDAIRGDLEGAETRLVQMEGV